MDDEIKINGVVEGLREQLLDIILTHKPVKKIILYGSRATENFRNTSDIDLAIIDDKWTDRDIAITHNNLEEDLFTPLKLDLVHFDNIKKDGLKNAILNGVVLYESE